MKERKLVPIDLDPVHRTKKEICILIKVSYDTLRRRLQNKEIATTKGLLDLNQQEMILKELGFQVNWKIRD